VNQLSEVSGISMIRGIAPTTLLEAHVLASSTTARESGAGRNNANVDTAYGVNRRAATLKTSSVDADPRLRSHKLTSADLLDSMMRQMGGAIIPSEKGSYVDIVV
jgi:hypothetical protein